jgi:hypothetical protein
MQNIVPFVAKISKIKTRAKKDKDYFVFRVNIPKEAARELSLTEDDFVFFRAMKAKWYHMLDWKEMQRTWQMLPDSLKSEIESSGLGIPSENDILPVFNTTGQALVKQQMLQIPVAPTIGRSYVGYL